MLSEVWLQWNRFSRKSRCVCPCLYRDCFFRFLLALNVDSLKCIFLNWQIKIEGEILSNWSLVISVGLVTMQQSELSRVRIQLGAKVLFFYFAKKFRLVLGTKPASHLMITCFTSRGYSGQSVKWTIHLHLDLRLRMSETAQLSSTYAFTA